MSETPRLVPLTCPTCGTTFDVSHLPAGVPTVCPKCRTIVTTPKSEAAPPAPPAPTAVEVTKPAAPPPVEPAPAPQPPPPPAVIAAPAAEPPPPAVPAEPPPAPEPQIPPVVKRTSAMAIVALVIGVIGLCLAPLGLLALLLAVIAFVKIRRAQGALRGGVPAVIGLLCGFLSLAFWVPMFFVLLPPILRAREEGLLMSCKTRMHQVSLALDGYRLQKDAEAGSLAELVQAGLLTEEDCRCPAAPDGEGRYVLLTPERSANTGIRLCDRKSYHRYPERRAVLNSDGSVTDCEESSLAGLDLGEGSAPTAGGTVPPPPPPPPPPLVRKVSLDLQSSTWRSSPPFDLAAELKVKLARAGVEVVEGEQELDGVVTVAYEEKKGRPYTDGSFGTTITLRVRLESPYETTDMLDLSVASAPPPVLTAPAGDALYQTSLDALKRHPAYVYLEYLAGAALGIQESMPKAAPAVLRAETRDLAMSLLEGEYYPSEPAERAALALARGEFEQVVEIGKPAVDALLTAFGQDPPFDSAEIARMLGQIGDAKALPALRERLRRRDRAVEDKHDRQICLAVVEALGAGGDASVLPDLAEIANRDGEPLSEAADAAAAKIRERLGR